MRGEEEESEDDNEITIVDVHDEPVENMEWGGPSLKRQISGSPEKPVSKKVAAREESGMERDARALDDATLEMLTIVTEIEGWGQREAERKRVGKESLGELADHVRALQKVARTYQRIFGRIEGRKEGQEEM